MGASMGSSSVCEGAVASVFCVGFVQSSTGKETKQLDGAAILWISIVFLSHHGIMRLIRDLEPPFTKNPTEYLHCDIRVMKSMAAMAHSCWLKLHLNRLSLSALGLTVSAKLKLAAALTLEGKDRLGGQD